MTTLYRHHMLVLLLSLGVTSSAWAQSVLVEGDLVRPYNVGAGGRVSGSITLRNPGDEKATVQVYQTDYSFDLNGTEYGKPGQSARSNAAWISYTPHVLTVGPKETTEIQYTVQVPDDPKLAGSYWSMIMVEPDMPPAPPPKAEAGKMVFALRSVVRYGIQIATTIPGTGAADLVLAAGTVVQDGDKRKLQVDIKNTGDILLRPFMWAEIYRADTGELVKKIEGEKGVLYPTCSSRRELDLTFLAAGDYQLLVVADNGDENVFGARYSVQIK
jgi:P pilus assembly chaperone PapD